MLILINQMYDANINAQKANLQASFDQNMSDMEANRESIAKRYQQQRNAAATDYERQRRNFNEQAMTNGLATGVGSQASLAQNSAYQKQQGQINAAEGTDTSNLERSIADLKVKYQNDINKAVADNDFKRAASMLDEYNNAYSMAMQKAQNLAQYGDFSGYADIYGADAARQMSEAWAVQNPLVAYSLGNISAAKYYQLTGSFPPGYSYSSSGGSGGGWSGPGKPGPETPVVEENDQSTWNHPSIFADYNDLQYANVLARAERNAQAARAEQTKSTDPLLKYNVWNQ